jgi:hypothetical protein
LRRQLRAHDHFFGTSPAPIIATVTADTIAPVAQSAAAAGQSMAGMSGELVFRRSEFASRSAENLATAAHSDDVVARHLGRAAASTQAGAARLDTIAALSRATSLFAHVASTPAAQRAVLTALRSQIAQTSDVVRSAQQQASCLAGIIRAVRYPVDMAGAATDARIRQGVVIWCLRPPGTFGYWRYSVLTPGGQVGVYWSPPMTAAAGRPSRRRTT